MPKQASLVYEITEGQPMDLTLSGRGDTTIGRHPQCTLSINQPSVSRRHARIWSEDGLWYVEDLSSSNGTFVNDRRVTKHEIKHGDRVRCGDFHMTCQIENQTREVGQIDDDPIPQAPKPRVVGSLSARPFGSPSRESLEKRTIGVMEPATDKELPQAPSIHDETQPNRELEALQAKLDDAQAAKNRLEVENRDLKAQCRELNQKLAAADQSDVIMDLERQVKNAADKEQAALANLAALQTELEALKSETSQQGATEETESILDFKRSMTDLQTDFDDLTSELRLKIKIAEGFLRDLSPVISAAESLRGRGRDRELQEALDTTEPAESFGTVTTQFEEIDRYARSLRRLTRMFEVYVSQ